MKEVILKSISSRLRYSTIIKQLIEEIVEWVLSRTSVKLSCLSINVVTVLNTEPNKKEVFPKRLMKMYL